MNLQKLKIGRAFSLLMQTRSILYVRLGMSLAFTVVAIVYVALAFGLAWLIGQAIDWLGVLFMIAAFIGVVPLYQLAYRYVFYMIKAAHLAVIAELIANEKLPEGKSQLEWGKEQVQQRFGQANVMFVIDEVVDGVVRGFTFTVYNVARMIPGDTVETLVQILNRILRFALSYIDEAILARTFWRRTHNVVDEAADGLVLYGMVWKPLLMNAIALMVISYIPFILALIVFALPVGLLLSLISSSLAGWSVIVLIIIAYLVKVAVGDAFAMTAMIASYQEETTGLEPDPEMKAKLESISDTFKNFKENIESKIKERTGGEADLGTVGADSTTPAGSTPSGGSAPSGGSTPSGSGSTGTNPEEPVT